MKLLVLGGTGRTGRLAVQVLREAGHQLRALHRREVPGVDTMVAGLDDVDAMKQALSGVEGVVSALASSNRDPVCSTAAATVIAASGDVPFRYVTVAGAGLDLPGDAKAFPDRLVGVIMKVAVGRMLADRQREFSLLSRSSLRWTVLRPPRLVDGRATGRVDWSLETPASAKITRADLAQCIAEALNRDDLVGKAPFVAECRR